MAPKPSGFTIGPGGFYRDADNAGPFFWDGTSMIASSGVGAALPSPLPAGTNRSGTITAGNVAQTLAAANTSRNSLRGQNISAGDLWINEIGGTAAADTAGSFKVATGQTFSINTNRAVSIIGATTGQAFTATET